MSRTAALTATTTALAVAGLVFAAPSASAADTQVRHAFPVAPGATVTVTQTCPAGAPYLVRGGFRAEHGAGVTVTKKIERAAGGDGWVITATNANAEEATVTAAYGCSTTPTTYQRWNNTTVRSNDPKPLTTQMNCLSAYPYFDTGMAHQSGTYTYYASPEFAGGAGVAVVEPAGNPQQVYVTFSSSYPSTTRPAVAELIRMDWTCSR
ncbi:hypothetical protein Skr01_67810 [Sphaerisporangium krabiense]|uniref:Secreted protein n=1 Tax=Sphaerisporangium krabiense TaxID=763782 RepID=A0A7W8Z3V4_9ACTN|nr:hypothetical protein [Sphaerisporangium krabiense]MBB5626897.1 hypothetical protein [Sphaerisporangium krabiense]GII66696.1 hypothetical protein Skr01_67810 [Sphaerisporangium krabiense]